MGVDKMTLPNTDGTDPEPTDPAEEAPNPRVFVGDADDDDAVDSAEPTEGDEPEGDEAEVPDDDEPETDEDAQGDEPDADDPAPANGTSDKYLQKLAQQQAADRKEMSDIKALLVSLSERNGQGDNGAATSNESPSPDNKAIDEIFAKLDLTGDDDDLPTYKELKGITASIKDAIKAVGSRPESKASVAGDAGTKAELQELKALIQELAQKQTHADAWADFKGRNGFDGRPIWEAAYDRAMQQLPDDDDAKARSKLAETYFNEDVAKKAKSKPSKSTSNQSRVHPPSSSTRKPAKGTQTAPTGARGATNTSASGSLGLPDSIPVW